MLPNDYSHGGVIRSIPHLEERLGLSAPTVRSNKIASKGSSTPAVLCIMVIGWLQQE